MRVLVSYAMGSSVCLTHFLNIFDLFIFLHIFTRYFSLIPLTDWAHKAHSLTVQTKIIYLIGSLVQRGQNAHYVPSL